MTKKSKPAPTPPFALTDRMTGREAGEYDLSDDASVSERVGKYEAASRHATVAKRVLSRNDAPPASMGSAQDVKLALNTLEGSEKYHAETLSDEDLKAALDRGDVSAEVVAKIKSARQSTGQNQNPTRSRKR
ncbi:MAG: hypothetical protein QNI84_07820 [Henriciella sp.]|nr:hypothetical protein [Henriciella sp.]